MDTTKTMLIFGVALFMILIMSGLLYIQMSNDSHHIYKISGTNITCEEGHYDRCGYQLEKCSDGNERYCVTNVIREDKK